MGFQLPTSTGDHRISEPSTEGVYFTQFLLQIQDETMTFLCWEGVKSHVSFKTLYTLWSTKDGLFNRNIYIF